MFSKNNNQLKQVLSRISFSSNNVQQDLQLVETIYYQKNVQFQYLSVGLVFIVNNIQFEQQSIVPIRKTVYLVLPLLIHVLTKSFGDFKSSKISIYIYFIFNTNTILLDFCNKSKQQSLTGCQRINSNKNVNIDIVTINKYNNRYD